MGKREKTTKAVIKTARINPETSAEEREALEIIERLEGQGWNFKQIVVDAILTAGGKTPEMFSKAPEPQARFIVSQMEHMLEQFAQEIIRELKRGGVRVADDDSDDGNGESNFAKGFAKSFVQRQQRALGDDD